MATAFFCIFFGNMYECWFFHRQNDSTITDYIKQLWTNKVIALSRKSFKSCWNISKNCCFSVLGSLKFVSDKAVVHLYSLVPHDLCPIHPQTVVQYIPFTILTYVPFQKSVSIFVCNDIALIVTYKSGSYLNFLLQINSLISHSSKSAYSQDSTGLSHSQFFSLFLS